MLRVPYLRLLVLMSVTILVLLSAVEVATYWVFSRQLQRDGQAALSLESVETMQAVERWFQPPDDGHDAHGVSVDNHDRFNFRPLDDSDQNAYYFVINQSGKTLFQTAVMPVSITTVVMNSAALGYSVIEVNSRPYRVYVKPYNYKGHTGKIYIYELISREWQTLGDIAAILWGTGGVGGVLVVFLNFWLARRALEPARKAWGAQRAMLLELSHELKTPLATISAIATSEYKAPPDSRIFRETRHATALLEDILYFAQLQDVFRQDTEPVAVSDVTEDTVSRFEPLASARHMTIRGQAISGVYVTCTVERWSHLVSILLKNATQHGQEGSEITWKLTASQSHVTLVIENRVGSKNGHQSKRGISGIGLRIAERLVNDMRGHLLQSVRDGVMITEVHVPRRNR